MKGTMMMFAIRGIFKTDAVPDLAKHRAEMNEHLGQMLGGLRLAGPLIGRQGETVGFLVCLETENFAAADAYLANSPYRAANLYATVDINLFSIEVGAGQLS